MMGAQQLEKLNALTIFMPLGFVTSLVIHQRNIGMVMLQSFKYY